MKARAKNTGSSKQSSQVGILVLGMHRSGTSALTRMLNLLGCALPSDLLGANYSNPEGHWESLRAIEINDSLLGSLGRRWDDIRELPVDWRQRPETEIAKQQIRAFIDREFSTEKLWVLKEPRLCRLAPLWLEVIEEAGIDVRIVIPVRHPAEVACSLARRDGLAVGRSHLLWFQHLLEAEAASRPRLRVLTHFHELLVDWRTQANHIASELGLVWPNELEETAAQIDEFLRPELLHADARSAEDIGTRMLLPSPVAKLYETLLHVDNDHAWQAIARLSTKMAEASSLYSPGIGDLAQRAERSEQQAATVNKLLSSGLADPERWQQNAERIAQLREESQGILSKVEETGPLLHEMIRQIEAQREEVGPTVKHQLQQIKQWRSETQILLERSDQAQQLNHEVSERDSLIASLKQTVVEGGTHIAHLNHLISERDILIAKTIRRVGGVKLAVDKVVDKAMPVAGREGWIAPEIALDFDEEFYLLQYPDVAQSGLNPYQHYLDHGKAEGRLGTCPTLVIHDGAAGFDTSKETALVVSHEASRTGAPILSLNIVQGLQKKFNVVSLLLGDGPLVGAFLQKVSLLIGPLSLRDEPFRTTFVIDQLLELYPLKFAIVNSIESRVVLEALTRHAVPTVSLIHEFAAYTRPRNAFREAIFWAGETIFSTPITHDNAVSEFPELIDRPFNIVPQGRCSLLTEERDEASRTQEDARVLNTLRPEGPLDDKVVILGAGFVQQRKGVDLFIECAAKVLQTDQGKRCRFVWIGKGYDPENDMGYSVYLADQLRRSGLERQLIFMDETSSLEVAYGAADILLISSRLDPLPNVAIDAMAHGLPVICFEKTTGIANILAAAGLSKHCVSPYLDTADMAAKVLALAASKPTRRQIGKRVQQLVSEQFDMGRYIGQLEEIASAAGERLAAEKECVKEIAESGLLRPDFFFLPRHQGMPLDEVIQFGYVRSWATGIGRRKLYPGFHPGIYLEQHGTADPWVDPLTDYLRAGQPDGPWRYDVIASEEVALPLPSETRIALHLHVYYADLLPEMLSRVGLNVVRPDLFVSVPNAQVADDIGPMLETYFGKVVDVQIVPNRGRDIGPFLTAFGPALVDDYDLVGHVHTKKTADVQDEMVGKNWYQFLLENLLGGKTNMADIILGRMAADRSIGLVFPDDPNIVGWGSNRPHAEAIGRDLGLSDFLEYFLFPIGTMFWARVESIRPLFDLRLDWNDYPAEPLPYDGSILHALERLLPLVATSGGFRSVLTNVVGVTR